MNSTGAYQQDPNLTDPVWPDETQEAQLSDREHIQYEIDCRQTALDVAGQLTTAVLLPGDEIHHGQVLDLANDLQHWLMTGQKPPMT
jgi:hypothetical protein